MDSPEDFSKFSNVAIEASRVGSTIYGSMFSWIVPDVFSD